MNNETKRHPKIEEECQLAKRITEKFLKSLNDEIFDAFMEQAKSNEHCDMRKEDEGK